MRKRTKLAVTAIVLLACAGGLAALADFGDDPGQYAVIEGPPHGGGACYCTWNWAPVLCTAPDGSRQAFSNACFAGCHGYTNCARIVIARP